MLRLGVNIDHVATVRQARYRGRGAGEPDPVEAARICEEAGCHGITAHLREDRRHVQDMDIQRIREMVGIPLNLEMANLPQMLDFAADLRPQAVCMVPEKREELTTEGGLDAVGQRTTLAPSVQRLHALGIEVSLFIDPLPDHVAAAAVIGAPVVELHTGAFAEAFRCRDENGVHKRLDELCAAAEQAHALGLRVNAGHGLDYRNVVHMHRVPHLHELNIGHSIVCRALIVGMHRAVTDMLTLLSPDPDVL